MSSPVYVAFMVYVLFSTNIGFRVTVPLIAVCCVVWIVVPFASVIVIVMFPVAFSLTNAVISIIPVSETNESILSSVVLFSTFNVSFLTALK